VKVAVLVSGRGSNLEAILNAHERGDCRVELVGVAADRAHTAAIELAVARGLATAVLMPNAYADLPAWDLALADELCAWGAELVMLAGFMRIVGPVMLTRFAGKILNVHPALLPSFPGRNAAAQAIAKGVSLSGCTVHVVDAGVDTGPIVAQTAVPVLADDDAASLHQRIQDAEHALVPAVLDAIAQGDLVLSPSPRYLRPITPSPTSFTWPPLVKP
jgi:phosphoribosylglycinamide formyltransferase-1